MAYTIEVADLVASTVGKFVTLNPHQLSGHLANLDFWVAEVKHALSVLDGLSRRQSNRVKAQRQHIGMHDTRRFTAKEKSLYNEFLDGEDLRSAQPDLHRIDASVVKAKRQEVADSLYHFLKRCHKEHLLTGEEAKSALKSCELGWEAGDFA